MKFARLRRSLLLVALTVVMVTGCASTPIPLGSPSGTAYDKSRGRVVVGSACGFQLLAVFPIMTNTRYERAYDELKNKAGNDVIVDVHVMESWWYGFVGTFYCTDLKAIVYPRKARAS
jgi:hypothetical protein